MKSPNLSTKATTHPPPGAPKRERECVRMCECDTPNCADLIRLDCLYVVWACAESHIGCLLRGHWVCKWLLGTSIATWLVILGVSADVASAFLKSLQMLLEKTLVTPCDLGLLQRESRSLDDDPITKFCLIWMRSQIWAKKEVPFTKFECLSTKHWFVGTIMPRQT